jgi:poly(3-hydroxybutyrate) depolymerase
MTESGPIQGQGSSCFLEKPLDIFKAKGEVDGGIPLEGGIKPSDSIEWS